jgi:hypothetical protein
MVGHDIPAAHAHLVEETASIIPKTERQSAALIGNRHELTRRVMRDSWSDGIRRARK